MSRASERERGPPVGDDRGEGRAAAVMMSVESYEESEREREDAASPRGSARLRRAKAWNLRDVLHDADRLLDEVKFTPSARGTVYSALASSLQNAAAARRVRNS